MPKYEIESVYFPDLHHHTIVGLLTGLPFEEIEAVASSHRIWYTKTYLEVFHKLGFNTNPRFKSFDSESEYPCIMRCKEVGKENGYWYGWVYNNHWVYDTWGNIYDFPEWIELYKKDYRVTSMLQVWI
jgi:hypothetical protein